MKSTIWAKIGAILPGHFDIKFPYVPTSFTLGWNFDSQIKKTCKIHRKLRVKQMSVLFCKYILTICDLWPRGWHMRLSYLWGFLNPGILSFKGRKSSISTPGPKNLNKKTTLFSSTFKVWESQKILPSSVLVQSSRTDYSLNPDYFYPHPG